MTSGPTRKQLVAQETVEAAGGGGDYCRTTCPFCEERLGTTTNHKNFWASRETGFFGCHRCLVKGRLPGFEDDDQYIPDHDDGAEESIAHLAPPEGYVSIATPTKAMVPAIRYLRSRGVTRDIAAAAQIGVCLSGKYAGRVVIPVLGLDGRTWFGWSARLYRAPRFDDERTYQICPGMNRGSVVFNMRCLASTSKEPVLCCEGVFDAIQYFPHCTAFLGKPGEGQIDIMLASKRALAICLDGDAWREAEVVARRLRRYGKTNVGYVRLPSKRDPNSVDPDRLRAAAAESIATGHADY